MSLAWPLALAYWGLIAHASLYPFTGWRYQGIVPWAFIGAPWPRYWTGFDVWSNALGYAPFGLLLTLAGLRSGWTARTAVCWGAVVSSLMSLLFESLQSLLPQRVPSQLDWLLNSLGGTVGAVLALALLRWHVLGSWSRFRARWLRPDTHGAIWLLLLWPLAVLYPTAVPFGLGQVWGRIPGLFASPVSGWVGADGSPPMSPSPTWHVVSLVCSLWGPILLAFAVLRNRQRRQWFVWPFFTVAVLTMALSAALTYGPAHTWAWVTPSMGVGMGLALCLALWSSVWGPALSAWTMCAVCLLNLFILNRLPDPPYLAQSLELWEQGRHIRFHGWSQWLGWGWPFAALLVGWRLWWEAHRSTMAHHARHDGYGP